MSFESNWIELNGVYFFLRKSTLYKALVFKNKKSLFNCDLYKNFLNKC